MVSILVAEDDKHTRKLFETILKEKVIQFLLHRRIKCNGSIRKSIY